MTTPSELTERYVLAVTRAVPAASRSEVERELRATIADDVDARIASGADPIAAERAALTELGDPARLAADYADRPLHLIGPAYFVAYSRLLRLLALIVLPIIAVVLPLAQLIDGAAPSEVIGSTIAALIGTAVHLAFWVTLVFVILERTGAREVVSEWELDSLPELPAPNRVSFSETVFAIAFLAIALVALVWQQSVSVFRDAAGEPIPVVNPELWTLWLPVMVTLVALEIVFAIVLYRVGRWTAALAAVNAVLALSAGAIIAALFWTNQFVNPAFAERVELAQLLEPGGVLAALGTVMSIVVAGWDAIDGVVKTVRGRRA